MAYTLSNLETDIRNYTEVDSTVFSSGILNPIIKNAEKMADSFNIVKKQISALAINIIAPFIDFLKI